MTSEVGHFFNVHILHSALTFALFYLEVFLPEGDIFQDTYGHEEMYIKKLSEWK